MAMLQDIRDRIPRAVQIETLKQPQRLPPQPGQPPNQPAPARSGQPQIRLVELSSLVSLV